MRMKVTVEVEEDYEDRDGKICKRMTSVYEQSPWAANAKDASDVIRAIVAVVNRLEFRPEPE